MNIPEMKRNTEGPGVGLLLLFCLAGVGHSCVDPESAYRLTGIVCRLTYPAAAVLNEKTTEVIQAAFQHAKYPSIQGEKSVPFMGKLKYGINNLEIYNLTIGKSEFELQENEGIAITISNVSVVFKGTITYEYGSSLFSLSQSLDFDIESQSDLVISFKLYCGKSRVAADTSDCYLTFHKLLLLLQGDREPGWLKKVFTNFITLTVKLVVKGQICKEINKVANILADFIQDTAEQFLSNGNISVDIGITSSPVITTNYIESYHKGLVSYNSSTSAIKDSVFKPEQISEDRSLYFWLSDVSLDTLITAAYHDGRFVKNISRTELTDMFLIQLSIDRPNLVSKWLLSEEPMLRAWSASVPRFWTTPQGSSVRVVAAVELSSAKQDSPVLYFETEMEVSVRASYAEKKVILKATPVYISTSNFSISEGVTEKGLSAYLQEAVEKIGIPKVGSYLEAATTAVMDKQGLNLFDLINPEVIPYNGYVLVQMDFGFPQHLLVEFLKEMLE
ncbi:cholesteryl ester transfer protein isoform X1 [Hemibagrus wyckioides]|uniref:cholesteryl ester transfer protein isoform X1 n=1 Tax=Hemibagrus wyckioides TaxID=337641 RepID=UPI00266C5CD5|nr:cholesteryl ester transfer protein isoform X1 [Hemibagrus wyckioides]